MVDLFSEEKRSWIMSRVKGRNTKPEILVRSIIFRMGYRFRLHKRDLPGTPDIVLPRHGKVIFVHGCFWHGHRGCLRSKRPENNKLFWDKKIDGNIKRDELYCLQLRELGWKILVVWECETKYVAKLSQKLEVFLNES
jgi:DNA mismatch endonuclease, patch repair protein